MKYEVTKQMVEAACRAHADHPQSAPNNWHQQAPMQAAITAAIEASGLVERIAELEAKLERSKAFAREIWLENSPTPNEADFEWARNTALAIASKPVDELNKDTTNDL